MSDDEDLQEGDYGDALRATALAALVKAGVLARCPDHTDILLRIGDQDDVRHAQALAPHLAGEKAHMDPTELQVTLSEVMGEAVAVCPLCRQGE